MSHRDIRYRPPASAIALFAAGLAIVAIAVVTVYFQPQKLILNERHDDPVPATAAPTTAGVPPSSSASSAAQRSGALVSLEHQTSGRVIVLQAADGTSVLRFENLATSNGPDLHVYLSAVAASSDWRGYDRDFIDLGSLKGNLGNQNYVVPLSVDLSRYRTAVIWCKRFSVGFGVAALIADNAS